MENQHRKIKGYRDLNQDEIDLMNEVKAKGLELDELLKKIADTNQALHESGDPGPFAGEAFRWVSIAKTHLQQGLMAATRAVAKPEFF